MDHVGLLVFFVVILYILYEVTSAYKSYKRNIKKAEDAKLPHVAQFLPHTSLLFMFIPRFIKKNFYTRSFSNTQILEVFEKLQSPIFGFVSYRGTEIVVNDPDLIKQVCQTKKDVIKKATHLYGVLKLFGENIVTANDGPEWKKHRIAANPAFGEENSMLVAKATSRHAQKMFEKWDANNGKFDCSDITSLALAVISEAGFGVEINLFSDKPEEVSEDFKRAGLTLSFRDVMEVISNHTLAKLITPKLVLKYFPSKFLKRVHTGFEEFLIYANILVEKARNNQDPTKKDLLSLLIQSDQLSNQDVVANAFIFYLAGHETTANTVSFALGVLALNPDIQEKVYEEAKEVLSDIDESEYFSNLSRLEYTKAVFDETLRKFPSVVSVPKYAIEDTTLGGYPIAKNTTISISVYSLHKNSKLYPNPEKFDPERFLHGQPNPNEFVPFSLGQRSCIGKRFAVIEGTLILALTCLRYKLSPIQCNINDYHSVITLKTIDPIIIQATPRQ